MSVIGPEIPGARAVDLFAGSGALGLEALSRGAEHVTFVERAGSARRILEANIATLDADESVEVVSDDVFRFLRRNAGERWDIALADPPYGGDLAARLVAIFREEPFARILCVEHRHDDALELPDDADQRRYGDTALTFLHADR